MRDLLSPDEYCPHCVYNGDDIGCMANSLDYGACKASLKKLQSSLGKVIDK